MTKVIIIFFLIVSNIYFSQIVKGEEINYSLDYKNVEYSTYHYINSDYSIRSPIIFVINNKYFQKTIRDIPKIYANNPKQDYTDIYILGISNFDKNKITEVDKEIIAKFINEIKLYREFNKLSPIDNDEFTYKYFVKYLDNENGLRKYLICKNK